MCFLAVMSSSSLPPLSPEAVGAFSPVGQDTNL